MVHTAMIDRLMPGKKEHGWIPVVWLMYLIFFFIDPYASGRGTPRVWIATAICGVLFTLLYLQAYSPNRRHAVLATIGMVVMGMACIPWNGGALGFFIYAAAALPWLFPNSRLWWFIGVILVIMLAESRWVQLPLFVTVMIGFFAISAGAANYHFAQRKCAARQLQMAHDQVEHLAQVAERERIARDLHDLLGHTLSVITLKTELARKLMDRDPERARQEMLEVEQTSRAALADVREAISGFRGDGLAAELARARKTLETAGITVHAEVGDLPLTAAQETALALALREAVTNVVRHAQAQQCSVRLARENNVCMLEIADNGKGNDSPEGNGLRGMRERLKVLGGSLQRITQSGTRLVISLPLAVDAPVLPN
jgi:two-component system, NarL family, sensor histidine kinase DesK